MSSSDNSEASAPADGPAGLRPVESPSAIFGLIGKSPAIREVQDLIARFGPTDCSVLVTGETGTGKELTAKALHATSRRNNRTWQTINVAAISPEVMASHFFGHERGAFTGAVAPHMGTFGRADDGTIFFDEVGDMSLSMQAMMLRALQEGEMQIVGGMTKKVNVRLIFATNRSLSSLVDGGGFREDLYYRVNQLVINIPPLRDRQEDIPLLASVFASRFAIQFKKSAMKIAPDGMALLECHSWPGNIRELENVMRRAVLLAETEIGMDDLKIEERGVVDEEGQNISSGRVGRKLLTFDELEQKYFRDTLLVAGGSMTRMAQISGIRRANLYTRIKRLGLEEYLHSLRSGRK